MTTTRTNYSAIMNQTREFYDILVVGKSGNGKSSVCNTLLGEDRFEVGRGLATCTKTLQYSDRHIGNKTIRVIDTPDITNCDLPASQRQAEVTRWKNFVASRHPSLLLVAVRCDVRYTMEELAIFQEIERFWRDPALSKNLVVAFTFGDRQDYDIQQDVRNPPQELNEILRRARKRYLLFRNKDTATREAQARECFAIMENPQRNDSPCRRLLNWLSCL